MLGCVYTCTTTYGGIAKIYGGGKNGKINIKQGGFTVRKIKLAGNVYIREFTEQAKHKPVGFAEADAVFDSKDTPGEITIWINRDLPPEIKAIAFFHELSHFINAAHLHEPESEEEFCHFISEGLIPATLQKYPEIMAGLRGLQESELLEMEVNLTVEEETDE